VILFLIVDGNTVSYTFLQHDSMETVIEWVSLVLYTKYNLLKRKYPTMIDQNVAKILNCGKQLFILIPVLSCCFTNMNMEPKRNFHNTAAKLDHYCEQPKTVV